MIKCYFIMREDLQMSQAKFGVQIGHGMDLVWSVVSDYPTENVIKWSEEFCRRKIILKTNSLEKLENLEKYLTENNILAFKIVDEGFTELNGKTVTGLVIPPYFEDSVMQSLPKFKRLQLWK